jgi:polyferredoxin
VNWFLQLDPLAALGSLAASGELFAGMAWALATIAGTLVLGRFFCGWLCPFGTLHHFLGWLGRRGLRAKARETVLRHFDLKKLLPRHLALLRAPEQRAARR